MNKYKPKGTKALPIIFVINEKIIDENIVKGGLFRDAIDNIMKNFEYKGVDAIMSIVSFGDEVQLRSGFKKYSEYTEVDWPTIKTGGKTDFKTALLLVKDMIEDYDTTPKGNYDPIIILFPGVLLSGSDSFGLDNFSASTFGPELEALSENGRFKSVQRFAIIDYSLQGEMSLESFLDDVIDGAIDPDDIEDWPSGYTPLKSFIEYITETYNLEENEIIQRENRFGVTGAMTGSSGVLVLWKDRNGKRYWNSESLFGNLLDEDSAESIRKMEQMGTYDRYCPLMDLIEFRETDGVDPEEYEDDEYDEDGFDTDEEEISDSVSEYMKILNTLNEINSQ